MIGIPILMYHKVGAPVASKADSFLNVSARDFARQMGLLKRLGYTGITFEEAADGLVNGKPLPRKPVCVTFDDGYTNVIEHALPTLQPLVWPATVFLPTAYVGSENRWDIENGKPLVPIMPYEELQTLQGHGWEIAGHTHTHPHLDRLDPETALADIQHGRDLIEQHLRVRPRTFCYPYGDLNDGTPALVRKAGFIAACTTKSGLATPALDPLLLPRIKVAYRDGALGFLYRLLIRPRLP